MSAHRKPEAFKTAANRNVRPGPDVTKSAKKVSLGQLVADAKAAEKRITDLEQTKKRTATAVLFENLDQALRIETAVECGQSVAAFARRAGIEERRAQRLYKLAGRCEKIKEEVQAGEAQYGHDFECPSWKQFLRPAPADHEQGGDAIGLTKTLIVEGLYQRLEAAQTRIDELETAPPKKGEPYGLFARGDPERETPQWLFDHYNREFDLDLDVAATAKNTKCARFFTQEEDGLVKTWSRNIWLNPPYSEIEPWCKKAWEYAQTDKGIVVALLPVWPTAQWFIKYAIHGHVRLLTTRVSFAGTTTSAPFDLMVVIWTSTSQRKKGRVCVTMEDVPDPKRAARQARAAARQARAAARQARAAARKARVAAKTRRDSAAP